MINNDSRKAGTNQTIIGKANYTSALTLDSIDETNMKARLANLWYLISEKEREQTRPKYFATLFICVFFAQIFSLTIAPILSSSDSWVLYLFHFLLRATRILPLVAISSKSMSYIILCLPIIIDIIFLSCAYVLSARSTRKEKNTPKKYASTITFLRVYFEMFRWILLIPKLDHSISAFICGGFKDSLLVSESAHCSDRIVSMGSSNSSIFIIFSVIHIITTAIGSMLVYLVYNTAGFSTIIPIKPRYSERRIYEIPLLFLLVIASHDFSEDSSGRIAFRFIVGAATLFFYVLEYFKEYPLFGRGDATMMYSNILMIYFIAITLEFLRQTLPENEVLSKDSYVFYLLIFSVFGIIFESIYNNRQWIQLRQFDLAETSVHPEKACLYFEELFQLSKSSKRCKSDFLLALGMLELHQQKCRDSKCPCQREIEGNAEQQNVDPAQNNNNNNNLGSNINLPFSKGAYIFELSRNHSKFMSWILKFIDYHFRMLLKRLEKIHSKKSKVFQDVSMRFWFFAIRSEGNVIKALFILKANTKKFHQKTLFFQLMELATSRIIENIIKTRDKSMKYSYRQKDVEKASQFELFERMVASEAVKKNVKSQLMRLLLEKQSIMETLISGFQSLQIFRESLLKLLKGVDKLERIIKSELESRKDNIEYLRLYSILKVRLLNDPLSSRDIENTINEIAQRDQYSDANTVNAVNILSGNVVSIISGFSTQIAQILAFSESSPGFFGYKKSEFEMLGSLNDLIPECIAIWHDNYMIRLVETGVSKIIRRYRVAIAKNKFEPSGLIKDMTRNFCRFFMELYPDWIDRALLSSANICLLFPELAQIFNTYNPSQNSYTDRFFELRLPRQLGMYLREYKQRRKQEESNGIEETIERVQEFIEKYKNRYNSNFMNFQARISIKQENIPFYHGGALILYLIEIQSYIPVTANDASQTTSTQQAMNSVSQNQLVNLAATEANRFFLSEQKPGLIKTISRISVTKPIDSEDSLFQQENSIQKTDQNNGSHSYYPNNHIKGIIHTGDGGKDAADERQMHFLNSTMDLNLSAADISLVNLTQQNLLDTYPNQGIDGGGGIGEYYNQEIYTPVELPDHYSASPSQPSSFRQSLSGDRLSLGKKKSLRPMISLSNKNINDSQLPLEGSQSAEEFSQKIKQLSRKSGTIIEMDQQTISSSESKKSKSENDHESTIQSWEKVEEEKSKEKQSQGGHEGSVSSRAANTTRYNSVKQIHVMASQRSVPRFLQALYYSYATQWLVFVVLSVVLGILLLSTLYDLQHILSLLHFSSIFSVHSCIPFNSAMSQALENQGVIIPIAQNINTYSNTTIANSFNVIKQAIDDQIEEPKMHYYQNIMFDSIIQTMPMLSSLIVSQNDLFALLQTDQNAIRSTDPFLSGTAEIFKLQDALFDEVDSEFRREMEFLLDNVRSLNLFVLITSIGMFIVFFVLIVPPFKNYRDQLIRLLTIVSRITEDEALLEIKLISQALRLLNSETEEYLSTKFGEIPMSTSNNEGDQQQSIPLAKTGNLKKTIRKPIQQTTQGLNQTSDQNGKNASKQQNEKKYSSVYLNDRFQSLSLSFLLIVVVLIVLVMCSSVFVVVYVIVNDFLITFEQPMSDEHNLSKAIRSFSSLNFAKNCEILGLAVKEYQLTHPAFTEFPSFDTASLDQWRIQLIESASDFLLQDFMRMGIDSNQGQSLKDFLSSINSGETCTKFTEILESDLERDQCAKSVEGLINIGLKNAMTAIFVTSKEISLTSQFLTQIQSTDYMEELNVERIVMKILLNVLDRVSSDNQRIIDSYALIVLLVYCVGGFIITGVFAIMSFFSFVRTLQNFFFIRKAIYIIPFKRLVEDNNTRFLLKKFIDI